MVYRPFKVLFGLQETLMLTSCRLLLSWKTLVKSTTYFLVSSLEEMSIYYFSTLKSRQNIT